MTQIGDSGAPFGCPVSSAFLGLFGPVPKSVAGRNFYRQQKFRLIPTGFGFSIKFWVWPYIIKAANQGAVAAPSGALQLFDCFLPPYVDCYF